MQQAEADSVMGVWMNNFGWSLNFFLLFYGN